jgi:ribosomal protein L15
MKLHHLKPAAGSRTTKVRVGRGEGGRRGKTAGRGTKGAKARRQVPIWFEGGQTPIYRQTPKRKGFRNRNKEYFALVNVGRLNDFRKGSVVGPESCVPPGSSRSAAASRCSAKVSWRRSSPCAPMRSVSVPSRPSRPPEAPSRSSTNDADAAPVCDRPEWRYAHPTRAR